MDDLSPIGWALRPLKHYADFRGRAPRAEYWWFVLFVLIAEILIMVLDSILGLNRAVGPYGLLVSLFIFSVIIPHIAVGVRRLHDTDHSGWWLLIGFIPIVGAITLLVFFSTAGDPESNRYGLDPYGPGDLEEVFA